MEADSVAAVVAVAAAAIALWQARIAKRGADLASRQANAAETQAVDAERSADAAQDQLKLARLQYDQASREGELLRQLKSYEAATTFAQTSLSHARELTHLANLIEQCGLDESEKREQALDKFRTTASSTLEAWFDYLPLAKHTPFYLKARGTFGALNIAFGFFNEALFTDDTAHDKVSMTRLMIDMATKEALELTSLAHDWALSLGDEASEASD